MFVPRLYTAATCYGALKSLTDFLTCEKITKFNFSCLTQQKLEEAEIFSKINNVVMKLNSKLF